MFYSFHFCAEDYSRLERNIGIFYSSKKRLTQWIYDDTYMALNEFSFELEFIAGVDNNIADAMSDLCRNNIID